MNNRLRFILFFWVTLLLAGSGAAYWYLFIKGDVGTSPATSELPAANPYMDAELLSNSTAYEEIRAYTSLGDFGKVSELYGELKNMYATGSPERNVVDYDYAFFLTFPSGKPMEGILLLKEIVKNEQDYHALTRALAVETLGRAVDGFGDPAVTAYIFEGEPLGELLAQAGGDVSVALELLYEDSFRLHPTPRAAARIAQAKAQQLYEEEASLSEEEKEMLRNEFDAAVAQGDESAGLLENFSGFNEYVGSYNGLKALASATRFYAEADPSDRVDADIFFKKAIQLTQGSTQVFYFYNYALFLSKADGTPEEIEAVTARIIAAPARSRQLFETNMRNVLANDGTAAHADLTELMTSSPTFQTYIGQLQESNVAP